MGIELDKDMAATLTEEELAAINDPEMSQDELDALKGIAAGADSDDDDDDDDDEGDNDNQEGNAAPAEGAADAPATDDSGAGDSGTAAAEPAAAAEDDDGDTEPEFRPRYQAQLPEDFEAQVQGLNDEQRELAQKFKDGEIEFEEYNSKLTELNTKRDELSSAKVKAEIAAEMNQQNAQQEWEFTVKQFAKQAAKSDGIDYRKDAEKQRDLDMFVRTLANDPKNNDKDMQWFLDEAHKRVKALHGISSAPAKNDPPPKTPEKPSRKPPLDAAPKTLAQVPGGDGPGDLAGEFADIDKLNGDALEAAIAKMTPAQRERYMAGA